MKHIYAFTLLIGMSHLHAADNTAQVIALLNEIRFRNIAKIDQILNGNVDINLFCIFNRNLAEITTSKQTPFPRTFRDFERNYCTPLHFAVVDNDPYTSSIIEKLLHHDKDIIDIADSNFETPLQMAIRLDNIEAIRTLLKHTFDINKASSISGTPLHSAALYAKKESVILLLQNGAQSHILNVSKQTPADVARENGHSDIAKLIESYEHIPDVKEPEIP